MDSCSVEVAANSAVLSIRLTRLKPRGPRETGAHEPELHVIFHRKNVL